MLEKPPVTSSSIPSAHFTLHGQIIRGKQLGRLLGFPTANIAYEDNTKPEATILPPDGVYIAIARIDGECEQHTAILNQGRHPTAPEGSPAVEAHLLDYDGGELYGRHLTLEYQVFLRPEQTFPSLEALKEQLEKDREKARRWAETHQQAFIPIHDQSYSTRTEASLL